MNILQVIVLGIIEGITEFLPISSTGHLILASHVLGIVSSDFLSTFEIVIQLGAILAVIILYGKRVIKSWAIISRVAVAFIPTAVIGLLVYPLLKQYLLNNQLVVVLSLAIGGLLFIIFEKMYHEDVDVHFDLATLPYKTCILIGLFQTIAIIPGVSRSGATILGGLLLGIKRSAIVEFSFLLAVPTMLSASALDLIKTKAVLDSEQIWLLAIGFIVSCLVAIFSIRILLKYLQLHSFSSFGIYRIILAIVFAIFFLI